MSGILAVIDSVIEDCVWLRRNAVSTMEVSELELIGVRVAVVELLEALVEMTVLAVGPPGGVTADMKRAVIAKANAAIKKATGEAA